MQSKMIIDLLFPSKTAMGPASLSVMIHVHVLENFCIYCRSDPDQAAV